MATPLCNVELICDGVHIHPSVVRAVFKMFGSTLHRGVSRAAPTTPGARWLKAGMALNRWVTCRAPRRKASIEVS